jgi:hypothetical protein
VLQLWVQGKGRWLGWGRPPAQLGNHGVNLLEAHEAHMGITVRVKEGHWKSRFSGMRGTVMHRWGHPQHPALDVRLEDGRLELFWFHELDKV